MYIFTIYSFLSFVYKYLYYFIHKNPYKHTHILTTKSFISTQKQYNTFTKENSHIYTYNNVYTYAENFPSTAQY